MRAVITTLAIAVASFCMGIAFGAKAALADCPAHVTALMVRA